MMRSPSPHFLSSYPTIPTTTPLNDTVNGLSPADTSERPFGDLPPNASSQSIPIVAEEQRAQRRPESLRRISSHRQELAIAIEEDQKKFCKIQNIHSQDRLVVTTSPVTPGTPNIGSVECLRTPTHTHTSFEELLVTPTAKHYAMSQSQNSNIDQSKLSPSSPYFPRSTTSSASTRIRNPAPPSPLSQIQPDTGDSSSRAVPTPTSTTVNPGSAVPVSPCFIHSHLDRTGTLQDWLQGSGSGSGTQANTRVNGLPPRSGSHMHQASSSRHPRIPGHQARQVLHQSHAPNDSSAGSSRVTSPTEKRGTSMSGYESDKSSALGGSAFLDGDVVDDDDDTGSLTRQLAETAQGVREMSKQLGRTRVRSKIQTVLIVTKARDNRLIKLTRELALYLMQKRPIPPSDNPQSANSHTSWNSKTEDRGMIVYVDAQLRHSKRFDAAGLQQDHPEFFRPLHRRRSSSSASVNNVSSWSSGTSLSEARKKDEGQLRYWTSEMCSTAPHLFDFVVTLGGDGTVLFTSWLFQKIVPPVLPFALGSLGFLTNFDFSHYKPTMDRVIDEGIRVNLRMRFTCTVYRAIAPEEAYQASKSGKSRKAIKKPGGEILMSTVDKKGWEALEGAASATAGPAPIASGACKKEREIMCFSTRPVEQFEVLNDLVVDRGPSPFVSLLELFGDEHHLTTVQADGLTVSTPTGSTAYSLSAGGSLVHPQIPALLITPICPHTLSFRPMLLPDSMELRICVPYNSRSTAWASFDGRGRVELKQGDHIKVTASKYPFPTVCADKASPDWFNAISRTLRWNEREKQKSFVVVEEDNEPAAKKQSDRKQAENNMKSPPSPEKTFAGHVEPEQEGDGDESDDEEEEEEEEDYDIDDKSGGNTPSPNTPDASGMPPSFSQSQQRQKSASSYQPGVDTPDRFVTHCEPPPALSQRHLVDKLVGAAAEMEISRKDNEDGQRDHIRSDANEMRVDDGQHMIPSGRNLVITSPSPNDHLQPNGEEQKGKGKPVPSPNPRRLSHSQAQAQSQGRVRSRSRSQTRRPAHMDRFESKAKAFAFFGQDDSASDQSEDGLQ